MSIAMRSVGTSAGVNSASCAITKPAGLAVGDFMLAQINSKGVGTISAPVIDPAWTIIGAQSDTASNSSALFWKWAVQADVDATNFTFTVASGRNMGRMMALTGVDATNPVDSGNQQANAAGTSIASPSNTVADGCCVLIVSSNAAGGTPTACSGTDPTCSRATIGYSYSYATYCGGSVYSGLKSGTGAIDAHATSSWTSAVSSGHTVSLKPAASFDPAAVALQRTQGYEPLIERLIPVPY